MKRETGEGESDRPTAVRVDKWLWAARFYKTRSLAVEAIAAGKIEVNGDRVKPSRDLKAGDTIKLRLGPYEHFVTVSAVSDRRGPAKQAALLYAETDESKLAREKHAWILKHAAPIMDPGEGRPTKKDRRDLEKRRGH
jgi:ribosome-associated heat shock protein Hsp15